MLRSDFHYALRLLRAHPGFTATAVLTLALGLGANSAMFSVIRTVLLRPLPYPEPGQLVRIVGFDRESAERGNLSPADFLDFQREARSVARMGAHGFIGFFTVATPDGEAERIGGVSVTEGFFPTLGARFALGRTFTPDEDRPNGPRVAILGHSYWQRRFGGDPQIVGNTLTIGMQPATVVGVLDASFRHVESNPERGADVFMPYRWDPATANRGGHFIRAVARLHPEQSVDEARAELIAIASRLEQQYPRDNTHQSVLVLPLQDALVENSRNALLMLGAAVAFVLLVACANLANLLLSRGANRRAELAIRAALGADRGRLLRQLLTESLVLSCAGAATGWLLARAALPWLARLDDVGVHGAGDIALDGGVVLFTAATTVATAVMVGLLPALQLSRGELGVTMQAGGRGAAQGTIKRSAREGLIAVQVALALVLLAGAGLMLRSLWALERVDTGFDSAQMLTFETAVPTATYEEGAQIVFYDQFLERVAAMPGVESVGAINILPLSANYDSRGVQIDAAPRPPGQGHSIQARSVSPGYFDAMGIPLVDGRLFDATDRERSPLVVIVSESMARRQWPGQRAVGQRITFNSGIPRDQQQEVGGAGSREVIGVVGDVKHLGLDEDTVPMFYTPQAQQPSYHTMAVVVRASGDRSALTSHIRRELAAIDRTIPLYRVRTLDEMVRTVSAEPRMRASLLTIFATLATLLSAIGVYGVVGYLVGQRSKEIAVRMALGAERLAVLRWLLWDGLRPVFLGVVAGVIGAVAATRLMSSFLFGITPTDAPTFIAVVVTLLATATGAILIPARRAVSVNPTVALRGD